MTGEVVTRADELREEFNRGFARISEVKTDNTVNLLGISLSGNPYALDLHDVAGVYAHKKITRIPSDRPGLLGIAGFRGAILPVYDLSALIGLPPLDKPRWLAVVARGELAIAFETFDGHLRMPAEAVVPNESKEGGRQHLSHLLRSPHGIRGVINLAFALQPITAQEPN